MEKTIGQKLKELRVKNGYSQTQLASMLDVSKSTIINWEQDKSTPDIFFTQKILELYDITFEELTASESTTYSLQEKNANGQPIEQAVFPETQPKKKPSLSLIAIATFFIEIYVYFLVFSVICVLDEWERNTWYVTLPTFIVTLIPIVTGAVLFLKGNVKERTKKDLILAACIIDSAVFFILLFLIFLIFSSLNIILLALIFGLPPALAVLIAALIRSIYK